MGITNKCSIYVWCIWNILFINKNRQPTCAIDNVCSTHLILTFIKNNDMTLKHTYYFTCLDCMAHFLIDIDI